MTTNTDIVRNWDTRAVLGSRVVFLNADSVRRVVPGQSGVVVWVADGGQGRDVQLADGRTVNVPVYELRDAPLHDTVTALEDVLTHVRSAIRAARYDDHDETVQAMYDVLENVTTETDRLIALAQASGQMDADGYWVR